MIEAGAIPETYFTVWTNVFDRGRLRQGETLLVHGGTSGIGTTAIMLAKAFGARVVTTAGSPEKCTACPDNGAPVPADFPHEDFLAAPPPATPRPGPDLVPHLVARRSLPR